MNLEALTLEVRPRTPWEAMDLGVRLVIKHWSILLLSWMILVLPIFLIIALVLLEEHPYWAFFLVWYLKPVYDQIPLFVLSRVIFAEKITLKEVVNALPHFINKGLISSLTIERIDTGRALWAPLRQLEKLSGKERKQRIHSLSRGVNNKETLFFVLCFHLETLLSLGLIFFILMLVPESGLKEDLSHLVINEEPGLMMNSLFMILYFIVMMLVESLYVAGGFALYLNRRIILEGWDIELMFKKLSLRVQDSNVNHHSHKVTSTLSKSVMTVLLCQCLMVMLTCFAVDNSYADSSSSAYSSTDNINLSRTYEEILPAISNPVLPAEQSSQMIKETMQEPMFNRYKMVEELNYIGNKADQQLDDEAEWIKEISEQYESIGKILAFIFELALWLLVLFLVVVIIRYRHHFSLFWSRKKALPEVKPTHLFGLEVTAESLPDNITEQAWSLYKNNHQRQALALLYRGSLAYWIAQTHYNLNKGATEGDCLNWVRSIVAEKVLADANDQIDYFSKLTHSWQKIAYAHQSIDEKLMHYLCLHWDNCYTRTAYINNGASDE